MASLDIDINDNNKTNNNDDNYCYNNVYNNWNETCKIHNFEKSIETFIQSIYVFVLFFVFKYFSI